MRVLQGTEPNRAAPQPYVFALAGLLGAVVLLVASLAPVSHAGGDSLWTLHQSYSLIAHGNLDLEEYRPLIAGDGIPHWREVDGRLQSSFPWGSAVVVAPFVATAAGLIALRGGDLGAELADRVPLSQLEATIAAAVAALTVALMFLLLWRRTRSVPPATLLALLFAFGTAVISTTTRALWMQGPALLLIVLVLHLLWELDGPPERRPRLRPFAAAALGPLLVLGYATRPTMALLGLVVVALLVRRGPRLLVWTGAAAAPCVAAFLLLNQSMWGAWQQPYYAQRLGLSPNLFNAAAANLLSPSRGLIVWTPLVLFAVLGLVRLWRTQKLGPLDVLLAGWVVAHLLVVSAAADWWWAGWSVGPRFMADVLPALFLLACPALEPLAARTRELRRPAAVLLAGAFLATSGWSVAVNVRAAWTESVVLWNRDPVSVDLEPERVWNWRDPQFLR